MEQTIRHSLWLTFLLYLIISFFNTAGLASHFEPNLWIANTWAAALEIGDVTLLLGTLKRKRDGKPYGGYLITFLISLAVSIAANVAEWTNNFLGGNFIYTSLHEFAYPWIIPTLLGVTIPALMLATGSMLSDFSEDNKNTDTKAKEYSELSLMNGNGNGHHQINTVNQMEDTGRENKNDNQIEPLSNHKENFQKELSQDKIIDAPLRTPNIEKITGPKLSYEELFSKSVQELSDQFNVSKKTIYNWRARAQKEKKPA